MSAVQNFVAKLREASAPEKIPEWAQLSADDQVELKFQFDTMMSMCEVYMEKTMKHKPFVTKCTEDFGNMDKNKDGVVSMEEFGNTMRDYMGALMPEDVDDAEKEMMVAASAKVFFGSVDLNKDGFVSLDEFLLAQAYTAFNTTMSPTIIEEVIYVQEPPPESSKRKSIELTAGPGAFEKKEKGTKAKKLKALGCC
jgi:Ca2+-binding EF-hand superfamily protein